MKYFTLFKIITKTSKFYTILIEKIALYIKIIIFVKILILKAIIFKLEHNFWIYFNIVSKEYE